VPVARCDESRDVLVLLLDIEEDWPPTAVELG
jgi:hypothetical protein